jgi:glutamate-1-semialdehyde 2,1-aminomutase
LAQAGIDVAARRVRSLAGLLFTNTAPMDRAGVAASDHQRYAEFFHVMLDHGIYLAPSGWEVLFTCTALDDADIDAIRAASTVAAEQLG